MEYFCYAEYCTIIIIIIIIIIILIMCAVFYNSCLPVLMLCFTSTQKRMLAILFRNLRLVSAKYFTLRLFPCSFHAIDQINR